MCRQLSLSEASALRSYRHAPPTFTSRCRPSCRGGSQLRRAQQQTRNAKGKGKGGQSQIPVEEGETPLDRQRRLRPDRSVTMYDGNDTVCSICTEQFRHGHKCARLECNHVFHEDCFMMALSHYVQNSRRQDGPKVDCPNCRAPGVVKAIFPFTGSRTMQDVFQNAMFQRGSAPH